ncbi:Putative NADH-cytochrome B5 reductase family protein [Zea mays]|uniref:Putative NADH-cytochrome B5 reductase family protein n=1 Tax=Zea mays TaxID=4577 RepID=K7UYB6_MAIZE|nr:Putative NADH-cytochrome B5 reductase family protein [Zea mays]
MGPRPRVCLFDYESVRQVLFNKSGHFFKGDAHPTILVMLGKGLVLVEGTDWVRNQRVVNPAFGMDKLKDGLDDMAKTYPGRFKIYYVLNQPPENWNGGVGFVSKEMIQSHCPAPAEDIQILRCGPPPMNKAMAAHLDELNYTKEMQFQF